MLAARHCLTHISPAKGLDDGCATVMHANNHRRRGAFACDAFDDLRGCAMGFAQTSDLLAADQPEQSGVAYCGERIAREKGGAVYFRSCRRDDIFCNLLERLEPYRCGCGFHSQFLLRL